MEEVEGSPLVPAMDSEGVPEMVRRVARAIARNKRAPAQRTVEIIDRAWPAYCGQARAAIEEIHQRLREVVQTRAAHYRKKAADRDPLEDDDLNRHDQYTFAVEVMDWVEAEIDAALGLKS